MAVVGSFVGISLVEERIMYALCTSTLGAAFVVDSTELLPFLPTTIHSLVLFEAFSSPG
jgi:hypothetical protein